MRATYAYKLKQSITFIEGASHRKTNIHAVRTSGEEFISSLHCDAKKEKSKRVPGLGGRELTDLSLDVLTA